MPDDWTTDLAEIPPNGERQDMTLDKVGFARDHKPEDEEPTKIVLRAVIDNGEYEGFQVSHRASPLSLAQYLAEMGLSFPIPNPDPHSMVETLREYFTKEHRFSARVVIHEKQTEKERLVRYSLVEFDEPEEEAEINLQSEPKQFYR